MSATAYIFAKVLKMIYIISKEKEKVKGGNDDST